MVSPGTGGRSVFEDAPDGMILYEGETGAIVDVNTRFCELSRYTRDQLTQMDIEAVTVGEQRPPVSSDSFEGTSTATWWIEGEGGSPVSLALRVTTITNGGESRLLGTVRSEESHHGEDADRSGQLDGYMPYLDEVLDAIGDIVYAVDGTGRLTVANEAFVRLSGAPREQIVGEQLDTLLADGRIPDGLLADDYRNRDSKFETRTGDGARTLEHHVVPLSEEDGAGFVDIARDITRRKEREEKLQQIKENVTDVVWIFDPQKEVTEFVSDSYEEVWGREPEMVLDGSISFTDTIHPDDRERVETAQAEQRTNPDDYEETYQIRRPDGEVRWVHDQSSGVYEDGTLKRVVGIASDITKRKERERQLQWFRRAVENAGHAIFIANEDGQIEYVNPAFETQTGYTESEALGRDISTLHLDGDDGRTTTDIWETLDAGEQWKGELVCRRRSGERYSVEQTLAPVLDEQGALERVVGVVTDITEYRQRQQQFEVLQRLLRHDLRNNMNTVLMNARPLAMESDDERIQKRCQMITEVAQETIELSNKVKRAASALQAEGGTTSRIDISAEISDEVEKLRSEYSTAEISTDIEVNREVLASDLIDRAIRNVMQNAIEHNDIDTPELTVWTEADDTEVSVHIADNGPGISSEQTDALEAGDPARLDEFEGIGLWLVNWIVTSSGGELSFADNDPRGTVVTLTLPKPTAEES